MSDSVNASNSQTPEKKSLPRVTLTKPPVLIAKFGVSSGSLVPPVGLMYIAASIRKHGFPLKVIDPVADDPLEVNPVHDRPYLCYGWGIDKIVSSIPEDSKYIGVSCLFTHEWPIAKMLIRKIRENFSDSVIIVGGEHITALPEFSLRDCPDINFAVLGEGEESLVELIKILEQGRDPSCVEGLVFAQNDKIVFSSPHKRIRNIDSLPWPAWDMIPIENYLNNRLSFGVTNLISMPILATRGCPYQCTFCTKQNMWQMNWYARNPVDVVDEIEAYIKKYKAQNFDFYDMTAIVKKQWIIEFCKELIKRELNISWQLPSGTRSEALDEEVISYLSRTGYRNLVYAPENGSNRILKITKKRINLDNMLASMRVSVRYGLSIKLNMLFGFPQERISDIINSYKFLAKSAWIGIDDISIATFMPFPGSALYNELVSQGKVGAINDDFCYDLVGTGDIRCAVSYNENMSGRAILFYKISGLFLFYSLSYIFKPKRFFKTFVHLFNKNYETRIEKALGEFIQKLRIYKKT